jgi:uncharacterized membrane protein
MNKHGFIKAALTFACAAVFCTALAFRLHGLDWDSGHHQHPDERFMTMVAAAIEIPENLATYFNTEASPANPYNQGFNSYVYGTLPLLAARLIGEWTGHTSYDDINLTGRILSAFMDALTALLAILIARLWLRPAYAVLSGLLYALCVFPIQQAHFFTADSMATALITLTLLFACRLACGKHPLNGLAAGLAFGLALASRINLLIFLPLLPAAYTLAFFTRPSSLKNQFTPTTGGAGSTPPTWPSARMRMAGGLLLSLVAALLTFRLFQPYAFDGIVHLSQQWINDLAGVIGISTGEHDVPYTRQWAGRLPWLFPATNIIRYGTGWALGITATVGLLFFSIKTAVRFMQDPRETIQDNRAVPLLCAAWIMIVFLYHGRTFLMTMRYFLPLYPPLSIFAAWMLQGAADTLKRARFGRLLRLLPVLIVTGSTLLWSLAFSHIYRVPHSRVIASEWMVDSIPSGSTLAVEHWDDALPLPVPGAYGRYRHISLPLYENDTPAKLQQLIDLLERTDYIVLASNRLYDSIPRLPKRYPMTIRYYNALFDGTLGFKRIADITSYPELAGITFPDQIAEEAFTVYDHPRVQIFRKTDQWNRSATALLLGDGIDWQSISHRSARNSRTKALAPPRLSPAAQEALLLDRPWLKGRDASNGLFNPDTFSNRHPIRTWVLMMMTFQLIGLPLCSRLFAALPDRGWLAARITSSLLLTLILWLCGRFHLFAITPFSVRLSVGIALLYVLVSMVRNRRHWYEFLQQRWRLLAGEELFFWSLFCLFLIIRAGNPDLWHPYFGGEKPMDFAYLTATVRSTFFPPYNPWFSGEYINYYYMGFVVCSLWIKLTGIMPAIAYNLIIPTLAALSGALLLTGGGVLADAFRSSEDTANRFYLPAGIITALIALIAGNYRQWVVLFKENIPNWDWYWLASRAITTPEGAVPPITEFPFFTFLYGDLHAHMIGFPFLLLTLAVCITLVKQQRLSIGLFLLLAANTAISYTINAWDYPLQAACIAAAMLLCSTGTWRRRILRTLLLTGSILVAGRLITLPFHLDFLSGYNRFTCWSGPRTSWTDWLLIHGIFIFPILTVSPLLALSKPRPWGNRLFQLWIMLLAGAVALILAVEFIVLEGDIGRMNTVFKFYLQVWFLLALCAGSIVALPLMQWRRHPFIAATTLFAMLLLWSASLLYPVTAIPARWRDRFNPSQGFGLNGQAFMREAVYRWREHNYPLDDDFQAMQWLLNNTTGTPVIIEALLPEYRWGSRYSIHTGLPTPLGWAWHQRQQHAAMPHDSVQPRADDIQNFYSSTSAHLARRIAEKYNARYFIIGPAERAAYPERGLRKFAENTPGHWRPVYTNRAITIYQMK